MMLIIYCTACIIALWLGTACALVFAFLFVQYKKLIEAKQNYLAPFLKIVNLFGVQKPYVTKTHSAQKQNNKTRKQMNDNTKSVGGFVDEALPLITVQNGKFIPNEQTLQMIAKLKGPIAVISIAGIYRSGKSFLLNQLLRKQIGYVHR